MKRAEFIRLSVLALVGSTLPLPTLKQTGNIIKGSYKKWVRDEHGDVLAFPLKKYAMKVTMELLHDAEGFEFALNEVIKERGKPDKIEIGYENDDFIKNLKTILLTYNK